MALNLIKLVQSKRRLRKDWNVAHQTATEELYASLTGCLRGAHPLRACDKSIVVVRDSRRNHTITLTSDTHDVGLSITTEWDDSDECQYRMVGSVSGASIDTTYHANGDGRKALLERVYRLVNNAGAE